MIEQGIYFALGCIVTALGALAFAPLFWSRAMRLSRKRLQLQIPVSMQEIYAERDGLRANFAVETLRVEQAMERVQAGKAADMAEIGRRTVEASRLAGELNQARGDLSEARGGLAGLRDAHAALQAAAATAAASAEAAAAVLRDELRAAQAERSDARAELIVAQAEVVEARAKAAAALARREAKAEADAAPPGEPTQALAAPDTAKLEAELAAARDREKGLHLQNSLKAGKDRSADRAAAERLERLEAENATLRSALEAAEREREAAAAGDAGLRESIHALGLAVAAMARDARPSEPAVGDGVPA